MPCINLNLFFTEMSKLENTPILIKFDGNQCDREELSADVTYQGRPWPVSAIEVGRAYDEHEDKTYVALQIPAKELLIKKLESMVRNN